MRSIRLAVALTACLLLTLSCSAWNPDAPSGDEGTAADSSGTPVASVVQSQEAAPDSGSTVAVAGPTGADDPVSPGDTSQVVQSPGDTLVAPPAAALSAAALTNRLDQIAAGQAALATRLDSLVGPGAIRQDGGPSTDAQEVLGAARQQFRSFGVGVVWAILVVIIFNYLVKALVWLLDALAERNPSSRLFYKKLVPIVRILLWVFASYLIVRVIFNVTAQGILAAAAAIGVAIGFAAQDLLKNLFGGIILVFDQPFQVGDKISVGGTYGEVVSIGLRSTRLVTPDDNLVSVPNAQVVDGQVANANAGELNCQVVTDLYLPGWVDEGRAKKIAFEAAASSKYLYMNKPIVVLVKDEFKETFLTRVRVKAYVLDPRYEFLFQSDVTERARAGFREAGLLQPEHGLRAFLDLSRVHVAPTDEQ